MEGARKQEIWPMRPGGQKPLKWIGLGYDSQVIHGGCPKTRNLARRPGGQKSLKLIGLGKVVQGVHGWCSKTRNLAQEAKRPEIIKIDWFRIGFPMGRWRVLENKTFCPGGKKQLKIICLGNVFLLFLRKY